MAWEIQKRFSWIEIPQNPTFLNPLVCFNPFQVFCIFQLKRDTHSLAWRCPLKQTNYLYNSKKKRNSTISKLFWLHCDFLWAASWRKPKIYGCRSCKRWRKHDCTRVPTICTVFLAILLFIPFQNNICKFVYIENWLQQKVGS